MILEGLMPVRGPKMQVSLVSRAMHLWMGIKEEDYGQMWLWEIMGLQVPMMICIKEHG